jgi:hypothetical protein
MRLALQFLKWATRSERRTTKRPRPAPGFSVHHRRLVCEPLEDRRLLSIWTVTNTNDSGADSLRYYISNAAAGDTIQFAGSLAGHTITLASTLPSITTPLTIVGLGASQLTIDGGNAYTVFNVASNVTAAISGMTITHGYTIYLHFLKKLQFTDGN